MLTEKVSVVIPTYNAGRFLPNLIEKIQAQSIEHELLIVDSGSTDSTQPFLTSKGIDFKVISSKEFNHGTTRDYALGLSKNKYLVYVTQDAIPYDEFTFEKLVRPLVENEQIAVTYGRQLPHEDADIFSQFARTNNYPDKSLLKDKAMIKELGIKTCSNSNSFAAYNKDIITQFGGFPHNVIMGEDVIVAAKAIQQGFKVYYNGDAKVYHSHNYTLSEEFKRYFDIGVFHENDKWILRDFANAEKSGFKFVKEEMEYLIKHSKQNLILYGLLRNFVKYFGYKLGKSEKSMPLPLKKKLSMYKGFWSSEMQN